MSDTLRDLLREGQIALCWVDLDLLRAEGWEVQARRARDPASGEWYPLWRATQIAQGEAQRRAATQGPIRDGGWRG